MISISYSTTIKLLLLILGNASLINRFITIPFNGEIIFAYKLLRKIKLFYLLIDSLEVEIFFKTLIQVRSIMGSYFHKYAIWCIFFQEILPFIVTIKQLILNYLHIDLILWFKFRIPHCCIFFKWYHQQCLFFVQLAKIIFLFHI